MRLTRRELGLLHSLAEGHTLKAHRDIDGNKVYRLRRLDGQTEEVPAEVVQQLVERHLLDSNKKFPAATFYLTDLAVEVIGMDSATASTKGLVARSAPPARPSAGI
jgi:hypothetical protein